MYARDTRPSSLPAIAGQRGMALLTTILMMTLMSALLVGFTTAVMSDQAYRAVDRDRARAFYGAQSGIEKQNADLAQLFLNQVGPTDAQITALGATVNRPSIPNITFVDVGASPAYQVQPLGPAANSVLSSGPYAGLIALTRQIQLDATARAVDGGEVHLRRLVETFAIPVFQFGIFSSVDLSFSAADNFSFGGRVHTNANLFLAQGAGTTLTLSDKVTAVGQVVRQRLSNRESIDASSSTGTVNMTRGNSTGPFRALARTEGSVTDGVFPAPSLNSSWPNISLSTYNGNIRNGLTGVTPLNLDLVTANGANIDLIKRPVPSESASSPIFAERYFKKVSVRVLLSDTAADITSLPTVSAGDPVQLDGDWFAAPPAGYTAVPAVYPAPITNAPAPIARSVGPYPDQPAGSINSTVNAGVGIGANQTVVINPLMPDYFKLQPNMTLSWNAGASTMTVTCTGKDALKFTGCSRTGGAAVGSNITLPATISTTFATIDGNRTVTASLSAAINWNANPKDVAIGTAGFPTAPFSVNTFFINGSNGLRNFLVTCTGYSTAPAFTGCNVPAQINSGDRISTEALSNAGVGRIGGFLKVEIQRTPNVWQDVTLEVLNHGISGPNLAGRLCPDPTPNAILRFQRLRDNNEPATLAACTYAQPNMPVLSTDHWPNVMFDPREGWVRDSNGTAFGPTGHGNRVTINGVMHYVALDVRNLSLWFQGTGAYAGGSGPLAMREGNSPTGGYSVYFSDRRNNRNDSNQETGEYGYEDVVNPADTTGAPNAALDLGEDMNANGVLDRYGRLASYQGVINTGPPGSAGTALSSAARPTDYISTGQARVNRPVHFRRALKLVNGALGNIVAPGLTVAAENPVYLQGHWNANASGFGGTNVATSVAADAVTLLSAIWNDVNSWGLPYATSTDARHLNPWWMGHRPRTGDTYYRLAIISGKGPVFPRPSGTGATYGTDGGVHSFLRFIEGDGGTDLVWYKGSMVTFYYHRQATSPFKCCGGMVYGVPVRQYSFDTNFLDPAKLPPLTPVFRDINALGFLQETRPGK